MTNRILDLSERAARLSVRDSLLMIQFAPEPGASSPQAEKSGGEPTIAGPKKYRCEQRGDANGLSVPPGDLAVVICSHPQIMFTQAVLSALGAAGCVFVTCNEKHMPVSMLLPLVTHSLQAERFAAQARVSLPMRKRAWQQIVRAKIQAQGRLLEARSGDDHGLGAIAARVRSGDPGNLEAYAARIYWRELLGEGGFRRNPQGEGLNACLDYGYAVLRAIVTRSLCGAGLHPSLGIHHHNRYDTFCLSDDLMEPFRPMVDGEVARLQDSSGGEAALDKESKRLLLKALLGRFRWEGESRTLFDWVSRAAASLAAFIEEKAERLELPQLEIEKAEG